MAPLSNDCLVDDHPHFLRYAADLANVLRNTIFVDQVIYPLSKKQEVLALLEEHITENIVKIGQSYYRQTVGIPQGSTSRRSFQSLWMTQKCPLTSHRRLSIHND
ncbi:hypothetical protein BDZ97DRAFT_1837353 [Flammula alnicola]|nr:hypothetical protein BDZ97DRAFT_1837353 [Flammula alnicola]